MSKASHSRAGVTSLTAYVVVWLLIYIWDAHIRTGVLAGIRPKLEKSDSSQSRISCNPGICQGGVVEIWFAVGTGVISGVVSAGILFITRTLIVGHLLPWYHDWVYRGINVDGEWHASAFSMAQDIKITIRQRAGAISGDAFFSRRPEEGYKDIEESRQFVIEGRIQDRYVTLTLSHQNRQRIGVVSILMEPIYDGRQLQGIMSFVSIRDNNLDSIPIHFARDLAVVTNGREELEAEVRREIEERLRQPELPLPKRPRSRKPRETETIEQPDVQDEKVIIE